MVSERGGNITTTSLSSILPNNGNKTSITDLLYTTQDQTTNHSEFLNRILAVIERINSLSTIRLHPNRITNSLFTSLVNLICVDNMKEDEISAILSNNGILRYQKHLREQCSSAEYFLEASFARKIQYGTKSIEDFVYYDNYVSLVAFEMESYKMYAKNISIEQAAVIGSGPLPLTSIEMLKHLSSSSQITNYDHSEEAITLSTIVLNKTQRICVENRSASDLSADDLNQVDLVYLAALVVEKKKIVEHLYDVMKPGSILIARTAIGLKTLVYSRITDELEKFSNVQEFHPKDKKVLNSIMCGTR